MKQWSAHSFQTEIPEIYQVELTSACDLHCPACIRDDPRVRRPTGFLDVGLLKLMVQRGDFDGSYFVELQQFGEPLMHQQFGLIIDYMRANVDCKLGMSTNGRLIIEHLETLNKLDYLTISLDSTDPLEYEQRRPGADYNYLIKSINTLLKQKAKTLKVDIQCINFGRSKLQDLVELAKTRDWDVTCREVPDCFLAYRSDEWPKEKLNELCLNPWLSVSVQWDGDVVPCCFSAGKEVVYGNLFQQSLADIWQGSHMRRTLQNRQRQGINEMPCSHCYMRSPVLLHQTMLMEDLKC